MIGFFCLSYQAVCHRFNFLLLVCFSISNHISVFLNAHLSSHLITSLQDEKIHITIYFIPLQATKQKFSARHAFIFVKECYQKEGLLSLWRGNSATMACIIPYASIQFASHEQYKRILRVDGPGNE